MNASRKDSTQKTNNYHRTSQVGGLSLVVYDFLVLCKNMWYSFRLELALLKLVSENAVDTKIVCYNLCIQHYNSFKENTSETNFFRKTGKLIN